MKTKWFVVATSGTTKDGRHVSGDTLRELAEDFRKDLHKRVWVIGDSKAWNPICLSRVINIDWDIISGQFILRACIQHTEYLDRLEDERHGKPLYPAISFCFHESSACLCNIALTDKPAMRGIDRITFSDYVPCSEQAKNTTNSGAAHCQKYYQNGAHAGNIHYSIESWGMNSPVREAVIRSRLDEFISHLQVD